MPTKEGKVCKKVSCPFDLPEPGEKWRPEDLAKNAYFRSTYDNLRAIFGKKLTREFIEEKIIVVNAIDSFVTNRDGIYLATADSMESGQWMRKYRREFIRDKKYCYGKKYYERLQMLAKNRIVFLTSAYLLDLFDSPSLENLKETIKDKKRATYKKRYRALYEDKVYCRRTDDFKGGKGFETAMILPLFRHYTYDLGGTHTVGKRKYDNREYLKWLRQAVKW